MDRLTELFIRDSKKYLAKAVNSLINIEKNEDFESNIETAFRAVHSIKTESSYLQMTETKNLSHEIENILESLRSGESEADKETCGKLISELDNLEMIIKRELELHGAAAGSAEKSGSAGKTETERLETGKESGLEEVKATSLSDMDEEDFGGEINQTDIENEEEYYILEYDLEEEDVTDISALNSEEEKTEEHRKELTTEKEKDVMRHSPAHDDYNVISGSVSASGLKSSSDKETAVKKEYISDEIREEVRKEFSDFELQLLSESMKRGEKLYRITCEISEDSVMKYPRLYLVINNLELKTNLIKSTPAADEIEKNEYTSIKLYITTKLGYKEIFSIVDVDEIENIQIINLPYSYYFKTAEKTEADEIASKGELDSIPVKINRLDKLFVAVEGMKLDLALNPGNTDRELRKELLRKLSSIEKNVKKLRMISFSGEFQMLPGMIKKMGYDLGKDVEIVFNDNDIEIDRSLFEYIYDPLIHILKNSVDHGIEDKEQRRESGKSKIGHIYCSTYRKNQKLVIEIKDDGRGLDLNKISEVSGYDITQLTDKKTLLKVLTKPGFSTKINVSNLSGRGFGLNLVWEKIRKIPGADIIISSKSGGGLTVRIILPDTFIATKVVFTKCRNEIVVINNEDIDRIITIDREKFSTGKDGLLYYRKNPVFNKEGRVYAKDNNLPPELDKKLMHGIIIKNGEKTGCFIADRVLFSQIIPADRFFLLEREVPYLSYLKIAGMENELSYLHSEILSC